MNIRQLLLENFRSYEQKLVEFDSKLNLILGPNGSGKTNILEAINFLSTTKSFRASSQSKLIMWNKPFASIRAKVTNDNNEESELEIRLIKDPTGRSNVVTRKFFVQRVEKQKKKYVGNFNTVIFHPEDIRLVNGSPNRRREFLDSIFSQIEWRYTSALTQYTKALKHRNELLDQIKNGVASKNELFFWDQSLVKNANIIHDYRTAFVRSANLFYANHPDPQIKTLSINYRPSALSQDKLDKNYQMELVSGYTQSGIHRDDFSFDSSVFPSPDKDLANWGSRGQQRLAVLAVRLAEIDYLEKVYHDRPVLLLDDIFSELDPEHQQIVVKICQKYQTINTSSEDNSSSIMPEAHLVRL